MACLKVSNTVVVDNLNHANFIDIASTLLAFVMVNKNNMVHFISNRFNKTRCRYFELVKRILGFAANFTKTNRFSVNAKLFLSSAYAIAEQIVSVSGFLCPKISTFSMIKLLKLVYWEIPLQIISLIHSYFYILSFIWRKI